MKSFIKFGKQNIKEMEISKMNFSLSKKTKETIEITLICVLTSIAIVLLIKYIDEVNRCIEVSETYSETSVDLPCEGLFSTNGDYAKCSDGTMFHLSPTKKVDGCEVKLWSEIRYEES